MAKQNETKSNFSNGQKKRAFCVTEKKYVGAWHDNDPAVYADIKAHRAIPGNENHIVKVIDEET